MNGKNWVVMIFGGLLLLPGLCGSGFMALSFPEMVQDYVSGRGPPHMGELLPIFALPSMNIGCLGLWMLARTRSERWPTFVARGAAVFTFAMTVWVYVWAQTGSAGNGFRFRMSEDFFVTLLFCAAPLLVGALPALLVKPK